MAVKSKKIAARKRGTLPGAKKSLQQLVNRYCRLRDCFGSDGANCISCDKWFPFAEGDGGHFIPTTSSATRFDERNVNFQCHRCNRFQHGNIRKYFRGMENKYGRAVVDELEEMAGPYKWTREEIKQLREYYKEKIRAIESGVDPRESNSGLGMLDLYEDK